MKKYEIKGWVMFFAFLFTILFMVSCRTVDKTKSKEIDKTETSIFEAIDIDNQGQTTLTQIEFERQEKLLRELVSSLQLSFNGQNDNDKLIVELQRSIDGLKFQVSGSGTANYTQNQQVNFEGFKTEILKRQDSLFKQRLNVFFEEFKQRLNESEKVDKEVKVKGFQVGFYALLIVALVTFLIGYTVSRYVRKYFG